MPRRSFLTPAERASLLAFPVSDDELIRHYTFSEPDLSVIRQRRGNHNRFGFAMQLCYLRHPGFALPTDAEPPPALLALVGRQLHIEPDVWPQYAQRAETRREHLLELQAWLNLTPFSTADYRRFLDQLAELAQQTDRGIVLAEKLVENLRQQRIILPAVDVIERLCSEALTRGTRQVYKALTASLSDQHLSGLDGLLTLREGTKGSGLIWLRQPAGPPKPKHILGHLGVRQRFLHFGTIRPWNYGQSSLGVVVTSSFPGRPVKFGSVATIWICKGVHPNWFTIYRHENLSLMAPK